MIPHRTANLWRILCALCIVHCAFSGQIYGINAVDLPAMGVPVVNYSPETDWGFGAAAQGYFRLPDQQRTSIVQLDGAYSLRKQWYVNAQGTLYFGGKTPWQLAFRGGYRDYPDTYYPLGNGGKGMVVPKQGQPYTSQRGYLYIAPQWQVCPHFTMGGVFNFLTEKTQQLSIPQPDMLMWGVGLVLQYDSRDIPFYPRRGLFFKVAATYYEPALGSAARLTHIDIDLRQYIPLYKDLLFAWQFRSVGAFGQRNSAMPFQMLPTLGGQDLLRGVPRNMFRDDVLLALQGELRIPLWRFIHATAFAGIGDVYDTACWQWATPKVGYGLGLRLGINRAKVNIRFDLARSNIYREWNTLRSYSFYLTATEAF